MSKINAIGHFETENWEVSFEGLALNYADLFIGFTDDTPFVEFKGLKFKYELKQDFNIKQYGEFPPPRVKYVGTDQPYIIVERLKLKVETQYELYLWVERGDKSFETTVNFTAPRPSSPYPSWEWDEEKLVWGSPVPYPEDEKEYEWEEDNLSWKEIKISEEALEAWRQSASLSRRRFKIGEALYLVNGTPLVQLIEALLAGLPEPTKTVATISYEQSGSFDRLDPFILQFSQALGMSDEETDNFFNYCINEEWNQ